MLDSVKFRLSFYFLYLGVSICPDRFTREWLKYGLQVAAKGIEGDLTKDESF